MSDKAHIFPEDQNDKKVKELTDKIIPILDGYTFSQIETCFYELKKQINKSIIINCSGLKSEV